MSVTAPDGSVWPAGSLRAIEHQSIRDFVQRAADDGYLSGRVLDYGCGYAPYREIVEAAGGEWFGYDRAEYPDNHVGDIGEEDIDWDDWDAVLCTQVVQYIGGNPWSVSEMLAWLHHITRGEGTREHHGYLVLTYPTAWPEVQDTDLHRFTAAGMEHLLDEAGFTVIRHESRASITCLGETFSLGGGVIARA